MVFIIHLKFLIHQNLQNHHHLHFSFYFVVKFVLIYFINQHFVVQIEQQVGYPQNHQNLHHHLQFFIMVATLALLILEIFLLPHQNRQNHHHYHPPLSFIIIASDSLIFVVALQLHQNLQNHHLLFHYHYFLIFKFNWFINLNFNCWYLQSLRNHHHCFLFYWLLHSEIFSLIELDQNLRIRHLLILLYVNYGDHDYYSWLDSVIYFLKHHQSHQIHHLHYFILFCSKDLFLYLVFGFKCYAIFQCFQTLHLCFLHSFLYLFLVILYQLHQNLRIYLPHYFIIFKHLNFNLFMLIFLFQYVNYQFNFNQMVN